MKMTTTMESQPASNPAFRVDSIDKSIHLEMVSEAHEDSTTVHFGVSYPVDMDPLRFFMALRKDQPWELDYDDPLQEICTLATPNGDMRRFGEAKRFGPVVSALGYAASKSESTRDGIVYQDTSLTYPSLAKLNTTVAANFPSTPLKFVSFQGGLYSAEEFVTAFAQRGEIMVATEQPYELHDHVVGHILGWVAMSDESITDLRGVLGGYVERHAAEQTLPLVAGLSDIESAEAAVAEFLYPSRRVMDVCMGRLDILTNEVAQTILHPEGVALNRDTEQIDQLEGYVRNMWRGGTYPAQRSYVPRGFLGNPKAGFYREVAGAMLKRYLFAERHLESLPGN